MSTDQKVRAHPASQDRAGHEPSPVSRSRPSGGRPIARFTKGPWVYKWFGGPQIGGGRNGATAICTLWGSWRTDQETRQERANRDLICAAPKLYELVELFERDCEYQIRAADNKGDDEGARLRSLTLHIIRETLAQARGQ